MSVREELDDLKFRLKLRTDEELANVLNTSKSAMDKWISKKEIPQKWRRIIELQFPKVGDNSFSSNTNSVIVNGNNSGSIINGHQMKVSDEFMEVAELFKKYGNGELLKQWKENLLKIKEFMEVENG